MQGEVTCVKSSPDSPFVFSFAGTKCNEPKVWDIREIKEVRERFYERMNIDLAEEEQKMEQKISKRRERALRFKNSNIKKSKLNK